MSYRNDTTATYDRSLLSSVPKPTRAEKQEGYKVDLLEESRDRRVPTPPDPGPVPTEEQLLTDGYSPGAVALARKEGQLEKGATFAKGPWYRTRWGITAIVIVIVLIIGAIVGGAVGGTHHSSRKSNGNGGVGSGNPNSNNGTGSSQTSQFSSSSSTGGGGPAAVSGDNPIIVTTVSTRFDVPPPASVTTISAVITASTIYTNGLPTVTTITAVITAGTASSSGSRSQTPTDQVSSSRPIPTS